MTQTATVPDLKALTRDLHIKAPLTFPDGTPDGTFLVRFSTFNVKDLQGDVVLAGAIPNGQETPLIWAHLWDGLPVGKGITETDQTGANLRGQFFTDTIHGDQAYRTVKNMGDLQEFSWGFKVLDAEFGEFEGQPVRFVKSVELYEVSSVLIGANRETGVLAIKSADPTETYADELERLLLRTGEIRALRAKAGRPISEARRRRLASLRDELTALLDETEPKADDDDEEDGKSIVATEVASVDAQALYARFLETERRHLEYEHTRTERLFT